jgi:hypothetical protein
VSMQDDIQVRVQSTPWYTGFELLIGGVNSKGQMQTSSVTVTTHDADSFVVVEPTMRLTQHQAQELMDSMWQSGLRPSDGAGSAGQLAATEKHLDDMRDISNQLLKKTLGDD